MNVIVGILLVAMNRNEENSFWLLAAMVEDTLYPGTYSRNLQGCQVTGGNEVLSSGVKRCCNSQDCS
jgi:hypothetical protein